MKKKVPTLKTEKQAEAFLARDLSNLDFSQFKPAQFEFAKKGEQINMPVPKPSCFGTLPRAQSLSPKSPGQMLRARPSIPRNWRS